MENTYTLMVEIKNKIYGDEISPVEQLTRYQIKLIQQENSIFIDTCVRLCSS